VARVNAPRLGSGLARSAIDEGFRWKKKLKEEGEERAATLDPLKPNRPFVKLWPIAAPEEVTQRPI
jgi:hypothetical protein